MTGIGEVVGKYREKNEKKEREKAAKLLNYRDGSSTPKDSEH